MTHKFAIKAQGISLDRLQKAVADSVGIEPEEMVGASKSRKVTRARILFCYCSIWKMGMSMTEIAQRLKIALPTVSVAVSKGEVLVKEEGLDVARLLNINI